MFEKIAYSCSENKFTKFAGSHPWLRPFPLKIELSDRRYSPEVSETFQSNQTVAQLVTVHPKLSKGLTSMDRYKVKQALLDSKLLIMHWKYITDLFKVNKKNAGRVTNYVDMLIFCFLSRYLASLISLILSATHWYLSIKL